jgi:hypothetical protein
MSRCLFRILRLVRSPFQHGHEGLETFHVASYYHDCLGVSLDIKPRGSEG